MRGGNQPEALLGQQHLAALVGVIVIFDAHHAEGHALQLNLLHGKAVLAVLGLIGDGQVEQHLIPRLGVAPDHIAAEILAVRVLQGGVGRAVVQEDVVSPLVQQRVAVQNALRAQLGGQALQLFLANHRAVLPGQHQPAVDVAEHPVIRKQAGSIPRNRGDQEHAHGADEHQQAEEQRKSGARGEDGGPQRDAVAQVGGLFDRPFLLRGRLRGRRCGGLQHMVGFHGPVKNPDMAGGAVLHLLEIVRDHNQQLVPRDLPQELDDFLRRDRIQVAGRLVGQNDGAVLCQRPGNDRALLLPAREPASLLAQVVRHAHAGQQLHGAPPALAAVGDVHQGQLHILQDGIAFDNVVILKDERDVLLAVVLPVGLKIVGGGLPLNQQVPLLVGVHSADDVEQGGFARAGFSGDGDKLPPVK